MKEKIGLTIFTVLPIFVGAVETRAGIGHFLRDPWPDHAKFHLFMGLGGLLACYGLILFLAWGPLRRGERWSWFAIAYAAAVVYGGQLIGDLVTNGGLRNLDPIAGSGAFMFGAIFVILGLYGVGLSLTFPHIKSS
jgi:hypothetical protein